MSHCGYTWYALYIRPDGGESRVKQTCILPRDHVGNHLSASKVIATNEKDSDGR